MYTNEIMPIYVLRRTCNGFIIEQIHIDKNIVKF